MDVTLACADGILKAHKIQDIGFEIIRTSGVLPGPSVLKSLNMAGINKDDKPLAYKEKTWSNGQNEDGAKVTSGYSLRGGYAFKKAVEGLKDTLQKGISKEVKGTKFRALDARKNGIALEIEVEMMDKGDKGIAVVKLYGPYTKEDKKDNVVMITKCKQNDSKYVTILAENIVKPLIAMFMDCETLVNNPEQSLL